MPSPLLTLGFAGGILAVGLLIGHFFGDDWEQDGDPAVVEVPGADSHYDRHANVIVLDERLCEYPDVREAVLEHEREHATSSSPLQDAAMEFRHDIRMRFGLYEHDEAQRAYYREKEAAKVLDMPTFWAMKARNAARGLWLLVIAPFGALYRWFRDRGHQRLQEVVR